MAKTGNGLDSQPVPEATQEGHLVKFSGPGAKEDVRLDDLKDLEKAWDLCRVMLTIGI
jgi:hypothetical protein